MPSQLLGGLGLFLLGMILLTDGLKELAGDALRGILSRLTGGPLKAVFSGAAVTVVVQSSSATTLATIGFVSAGLLSFPQAMGVILGANIGTTSTGWLVSLLGLKFSVSAFAMPLTGVGALLKLLARDRIAAAGMALAGFGLIFIGIDALQVGMKVFAARFDPAALPGDTFAGRLLLIGTGALMTVVMQSSSAAVATTLTALHEGAITLQQAAALVIGQNIGTTVTAAVACVGGSVAVRRTAAAHIIFNATTGLLALAVLPLMVSTALAAAGAVDSEPGAVALAAFHTFFNLLGVLVFLPWIDRFSTLIVRLIPERGSSLTRDLDATVRQISSVALDAARRALRRALAELLHAGRPDLARAGRGEEAARELEVARGALKEIRAFLAELRTGAESPLEHRRHVAVLHALDHVERLADLLRRPPPRPGSRERAMAGALTPVIEKALSWSDDGEAAVPPAPARTAAESMARERSERRRETLESTALGTVPAEEAQELLEGIEWLERAAFSLWRSLFYLQEPPPGAEPSETGPPQDAAPL